MSSENQLTNFDKIKNIITIAYPIIVIMGYYNLSTFYNDFGVVIYNYVDFSEILLAFLHDITILLALLTFMGVQVLIHFLLVHTKEKKIPTKAEESTSKPNKYVRIQNSKLYKFIYHGFIFIQKNINFIIIFVVSFSIIYHSRLDFKDIDAIGWKYFTLTIFSYNFIANHATYSKAKNALFIFTISIFTLLFIKDKNHIRSKVIKSKCKSELNNKLLYNNTQILNDSSNLYLGETKNYMFSYNCKDSITNILEKTKLE